MAKRQEATGAVGLAWSRLSFCCRMLRKHAKPKPHILNALTVAIRTIIQSEEGHWMSLANQEESREAESIQGFLVPDLRLHVRVGVWGHCMCTPT